MKEIAFIMYSHTDYSDVWEPFFGQTEELLPESFPKYIFVNRDGLLREHIEMIPSDYKVVSHTEGSYSNRIAVCLQEVEEEYCIFQHEDMMLYKEPNMEKIKEYLEVLKNEPELDFVKLLKGGDTDDDPYKEYEDLFHVKQWLLAIQPAIWRTSTLKKVFNHFKDKGIWTLEKEAQEECREMGVKGVYCYNGEAQRGRFHWDSSVYPYIATAINKGKWNVAEYGCELEEMFREYEIDRMKRGFIG